MKKIILITLISLISYTSYTQINYEKGYFIDNDGNRTGCLIKNIDWASNPTKFKYKLSENDKPAIKTIKEIKEFGVSDLIYKRYLVKIDRSSDILGKLSLFSKPEFNNETLFLKTLVEGNASLYEYLDNNLERYFYSTSDINIEQLVFKRYTITDFKIGKNFLFRQQLFNTLKCESLNLNNVKNLNYSKKDLKIYFKKYNKCINPTDVSKEKKQRKVLFNLSLRSGINLTSFKIFNRHADIITLSNVKVDYETIIGYRFGIETEFIMPFNKNKWSVIFEPTFNHFEAESKTLESTNSQTATIHFNSFELPFGIRHYFFLNQKSKIFINAELSIILNNKTKVDFEKDYTKDILFEKTRSNLSFGIGYNYNNKFSFEYRYFKKDEVFDKFKTIKSSDYQNMSFIFGYTLF